MLKRAAGAPAKQRIGDTPSAGEVADKRPAAPDPLMKLITHTSGAKRAIVQMALVSCV